MIKWLLYDASLRRELIIACPTHGLLTFFWNLGFGSLKYGYRSHLKGSLVA